MKGYCGSYGGHWCIYPWYSTTNNYTWEYGVYYPETADDYGQASQFFQHTKCGGPFGKNSTHCDHVVV